MNKAQQKIADQFAKDNGINVVYCPSCEGWYCQCPHCQSVICCYHKMCCFACFKTFQPLLDKLMEEGKK